MRQNQTFRDGRGRRHSVDMRWINELHAAWDGDKQRLIGDAPSGTFNGDYATLVQGSTAAGQWWRVDDSDRTVGYGCLRRRHDGAELLLVTAAAERGRGVGDFILRQLAQEATDRGLERLFVHVSPRHPDARRLSNWLCHRGFRASAEGYYVRDLERDDA